MGAPTTLVLLGGYGGAGQALAPALLLETDAQLVIAGRSLDKAKACVERLRHEHPAHAGRVRAAQADAERPEALAQLLAPPAMLLDLTTAAHQAPDLARTALSAKADFLDIHFQRSTAQALAALGPDFERAGRLLITQAGCHPGLPSAMVRAAARRFDQLETVQLGMALNFRVESLATALELVDEIGAETGLLYSGGHWREARNSDVLRLDLGPRFGVRPCYPMAMEELLDLPQRLGLRELALRVAGFNPVADFLVLPLIILSARLGARWARPALARLFTVAINAFFRGQSGICFSLEATGQRNGTTQRLRLVIDSDSPYGLTAWPVASCLRQYMEGRLGGPGLCYLGHTVDPDQLLADLERMGARIIWTRD